MSLIIPLYCILKLYCCSTSCYSHYRIVYHGFIIESSLKGGISTEKEVTVFRVRVKMTRSYLFEAKHKNSNYIQHSHVYFNNVTILEKIFQTCSFKTQPFHLPTASCACWEIYECRFDSRVTHSHQSRV